MTRSISPSHDTSDYPSLTQLGVLPEHREVLRHQGVLRADERGTSTVHQLRFRAGGRQRVKYVAAHQLAAVAAELARLQAPTKRVQRLRATNRAAAQLLRRTQRELASKVAEFGYHFHGQVLRRTRRSRPSFSPQENKCYE